MTRIIIIICYAILFTSCKKDIKKSEIGTTPFFVKSDSCYAFLANAFTPDGNGSNDVLRPIFNVNTGNTFKFTVRNKKQKILFTTSTPGEFWDGRYNGTEQALGDYIATLSGTTACGKSYEQHTSVQLFRDCISGDVSKMVFEDMLDPITGLMLFVSQEKTCP